MACFPARSTLPTDKEGLVRAAARGGEVAEAKTAAVKIVLWQYTLQLMGLRQ